MSFQRDVATTFGSQVAVLLLVMLQSVLVARYLLPTGRGQYTTLMLVPEFATLIAPLGLQWSMTYHLRQKDHSVEQLLQNGLGLALVLGAAGFLVSAGVEWWLRSSLLTGFSAVSLLLAASVVPARVFHACWIGVFRGTDRIRYANVANLGRRILIFGGVITALIILYGSVSELVAGVVAAEILLSLAVGLVVFRGVVARPRLDGPIIRSLISYGVRVYAFSILMFMNYRLDVAVVRYFVGYREVGYYVTAVTLAEVMWTIPTSLSFVLFPSAIGVSEEKRAATTSRAMRITAALMLLVCLVVALTAYPAIWILYGEAYLPAVVMLIAILPGILAMSLQQVLGADLSARGRPGLVTVAAAVGVLVNVALNVWWVPLIGALGAALASSVSYSAIAALVVAFFLRASGLRLRETLIIRRDDIEEITLRVKRVLGRGGNA